MRTHLALDDCDAVAKAVGSHQLLSVVGNGRGFDGIHVLGPSLDSKEGQDASPSSHVHNDLVFEVVWIRDEGLVVRARPDRVLPPAHHHTMKLTDRSPDHRVSQRTASILPW